MSAEDKQDLLGAYLLWALILVVISLISMAFIYLGWDSLLNQNDYVNGPFYILMGVAGLGIAGKIAYDMSKMRSQKEDREQKVFTHLECTNCGWKLEREFREGDFVGRISPNDKCPKCGSPMRIMAIYTRVKEKRA